MRDSVHRSSNSKDYPHDVYETVEQAGRKLPYIMGSNSLSADYMQSHITWKASRFIKGGAGTGPKTVIFECDVKKSLREQERYELNQRLRGAIITHASSATRG